jgi:hypothetical protein
MALLTELIGLCTNKKFWRCWTSYQKHVFEEIKIMIASRVLLNYPDPNLSYDIKPNTSQLSTMIRHQASRPLDCFIQVQAYQRST